MKKSPEKIFTKDVLKALRGESPRERLLHRLHGVALILGGLSASEAARIYGDSARAVAYWVKRFNDEGVAGLEEEARPGRPSKLDATRMKKVQTFLKQSEAKSQPVNADTLSNFILTEFGIALTSRQCWRILNRLKT